MNVAELPSFPENARFGDWNGEPASRVGYSVRVWPEGRYIPSTSWDEDATPISRSEFMRRVAALNAGS